MDLDSGNRVRIRSRFESRWETNYIPTRLAVQNNIVYAISLYKGLSKMEAIDPLTLSVERLSRVFRIEVEHGSAYFNHYISISVIEIQK